MQVKIAALRTKRSPKISTMCLNFTWRKRWKLCLLLPLQPSPLTRVST